MQSLAVPEPPSGRPAEPLVGRRRVVVVLREAEGSRSAIQVARVVARTLAAQLHGVLTWPTCITPCDVPRLLRCEPETLEGMVIDVEVGDPAERLDALARAHPVAFMVLAAEELGRDPTGIGAETRRTLARLPTSAIVVRPHVFLDRIRHILVPLDGTPSAAAALEPASELAQRAGAALDLVLIQDVTRPPPAEPGTMAPRYVDQPQHEWPAFSAEFIRRFVGSIGHHLTGTPVRFFLGAGSPSSEVLRYARELEADLVAMVWGSGGEEPGVLLAEVLAGAPQPVLVVRR